MSRVISSKSTLEFVEHQLNSLFPTSGREQIPIEIGQVAFERTLKCVSSIKNWSKAGFDFYVSWQYSTYLYFLSRELFIRGGDYEAATRVFLLNKAVNSIELYFKIAMPDVFFLSHTTGLVFAQATYGKYGVYHQGCTIGRSDEDRPTLESGVVLFPNSSVIGRCKVRANTVIAPGVQLVNQDTPGNCYAFAGKGSRIVFKSIDEYFSDRYFDRTVT